MGMPPYPKSDRFGSDKAHRTGDGGAAVPLKILVIEDAVFAKPLQAE